MMSGACKECPIENTRHTSSYTIDSCHHPRRGSGEAKQVRCGDNRYDADWRHPGLVDRLCCKQRRPGDDEGFHHWLIVRHHTYYRVSIRGLVRFSSRVEAGAIAPGGVCRLGSSPGGNCDAEEGHRRVAE